MYGISYSEDLSGFFVQDGIRKRDNFAVHAIESGLDQNRVVIARGRNVTTCRFGDGHVRALFFHVAIVEAEALAKVCASDLHPHQVIRIIDNAHLVGFGVTDTETGFTGVGHLPGVLSGGRLQNARGKGAAQFGGDEVGRTADSRQRDACFDAEAIE